MSDNVNQEKKHFSIYCDFSFNNYSELKNHITVNHQTPTNCLICKQYFDNNYEPEMHMSNVHKAEKEFQCTTPDSKFFLEWS